MNQAAEPITIAVVDDHRLVRDGLCEVLQTQPGLEVVGQAGNGAGAVSLAGRCRPSIVLLDVHIPGDDVTTTVAQLRKASPGSRVIIVTMHESSELLRRLLEAGVNGFLLKTAHRHDLVAAIRSVALDPARVVVEVSPGSLIAHRKPLAAVLSERELDILGLAGEACSNRQIARRLGLSEATVKRHLHNAFAKLDAVSRIDAVNKAVAAALIPTPAYDTSPCSEHDG